MHKLLHFDSSVSGRYQPSFYRRRSSTTHPPTPSPSPPVRARSLLRLTRIPPPLAAAAARLRSPPRRRRFPLSLRACATFGHSSRRVSLQSACVCCACLEGHRRERKLHSVAVDRVSGPEERGAEEVESMAEGTSPSGGDGSFCWICEFGLLSVGARLTILCVRRWGRFGGARGFPVRGGDGGPVFSDHQAQPRRQEQQGRPVRFAFRLSEGDLFFFWVELLWLILSVWLDKRARTTSFVFSLLLFCVFVRGFPILDVGFGSANPADEGHPCGWHQGQGTRHFCLIHQMKFISFLCVWMYLCSKMLCFPGAMLETAKCLQALIRSIQWSTVGVSLCIPFCLARFSIFMYKGASSELLLSAYEGHWYLFLLP